MPLFSVVVLHHNKAPYSRACLESLLSGASHDIEIINVDNGSRDETPDLLDEWEIRAQKLGIQTQRLSYESNIGAVRGRNEALKIASGENIAFLDNDCFVDESDWLPKLAARLDSTPNCALVTPKLVFPWEPFQIECLGCAVSPQGRIAYLHRGNARDFVDEAQSVQCAISAAWLFKRATWERVGPLDEAFSPVQYEDLDWCYRARAQSLEVWTAPEVEVFHFEHTTTAGSDDINFRYVTTKNGLEWKKRWGETIRAENGISEQDAAWRNLPKFSIDEVNWRALLPASGFVDELQKEHL